MLVSELRSNGAEPSRVTGKSALPFPMLRFSDSAKMLLFFCGQTLRNVERLTLGKQEPEANLSSDFLLFDEGPVDVSKSHLNFLSKAFKSFF